MEQFHNFVNRMNKGLYIIALVTLSFLSCVKDKPTPVEPTKVSLSNAHKVYVVNEGNYMYANASVSLYDTGNESVVENYYNSQNSAALGDVAQSMGEINGDLYVVVNNSGKVVLCDKDLKLKKTITGLTSPRYLQPVSNQKAYVTDLYANAISIVDLNSGTRSGSIPCRGWTEQMALLYNKVFVTNRTTNYLYVINTITNLLTDSIDLGSPNGSIVTDKNDKVWVLSAGSSTNTTGKLWRIDPIKDSIESTLTFNTAGSAGSLCINKTKDTLYFINGGICKLPVNSTSVPAPFISKGSKNFYGLDIDAISGDIYVSDALDYIQRSNIYIYSSSNGTLLKQFKAGINASFFYFR